jgi:succinate dehydrogenase / fumarate reductase cytochrome b subunit
MVRETFKSPLYAVLYTLFLLAAAFHAFNGFWTFLITWGVILSYRSQRAMIPVCMIGAAVLACLGLAAIWGSYWLNRF